MGDEVYATTRGPRTEVLARAGLRPLTLDVTRRPAPHSLPPVDTAVFAVGRSGAAMHDIHVTGLGLVLDALSDSTGRVIYVSTTGVYGQDAGEWVDEESVCEPTREGGTACLAAERLLATHVRGRNAIVLRLAGLYGPRRVTHAPDVAAGKSIRGSPDAYLNLIHVEDAARAIVVAASSDQVTDQTYNVADGRPLKRGAYVDLVAARMGVAPPRFEGGSGRGKRVRNDRLVRGFELQLEHPSCLLTDAVTP